MSDASGTEVLTQEENTEILEELQKNFPQSKESSISFPSTNKVNKKLSDLFNYIEKHTMEESEETKELEKRQIEAEIELAKAETKQAIRESERKFGTLQPIKYIDFINKANTYIQNKDGDKNLEGIKNTINEINSFLKTDPSTNLSEEINKSSSSIEKLKIEIKKNEDDINYLNDIKLNNPIVNFDNADTDLIKALSKEIIKPIQETSDIEKETIKQLLTKKEPENLYQKHITYILHTIFIFKVKNYKKKSTDDFISQRLNCLFYVLCNFNNNYVGNIQISTKQMNNVLIKNISNEILENVRKNFNIKNISTEQLESNENNFKYFFDIIMDYDIKILEKNLNNFIIQQFKQVVRKMSLKLEYEIKQKRSEFDKINKEIQKLNDYKTKVYSTINELETIVKELNDIKNNIGSIAVKKFKDTLDNYGLLAPDLDKEMNTYIINLQEQEKGEGEGKQVNLPKIEENLFPLIEQKIENLIDNIKKKYTIKNSIGEKGKEIKISINREINQLKKLKCDNTQFFSKFNTFNEKAFKYYLSYFPVKNIINLSTFVGGDENSKEQIQANNLLSSIDAKGQKLGKIMESIALQTTSYGPFYKILHTGHIDEEKKDEQGEETKINKKYHDITEEFNNLFSGDDIDHIIYAGYGFSGSGKTYTLLEKSNDNSILKQIERLLKENKIEYKIEPYSRYAEKFDNDCNDTISEYYKDYTDGNLLTITEKFQDYKSWKTNKQNISISDYIENINEKRKQKTIGAEKNLFRTSIRATSFNPESSRSHLFVDIKFTNKQNKQKVITLLDMAGNEDVNVLQEQYFTTSDGYIKNEKIDLKETITNIITFVNKLYDPVENALYSSSNANVIKGKNASNLINIEKYLQNNFEYNIKKKSWEELFKELGPRDKEKFVQNYNEYQIYEQIENFNDINKGLKLLEEKKFKSLSVARTENKENYDSSTTENKENYHNNLDYYVLKNYKPYDKDNTNFKQNELFNVESLYGSVMLVPKKGLKYTNKSYKLDKERFNKVKNCLMSTIDQTISKNCFKDLSSIFLKGDNVVKNFNKIENILAYGDFLMFNYEDNNKDKKPKAYNNNKGINNDNEKIHNNLVEESKKTYKEHIKGKYSFSGDGKSEEQQPKYLNTLVSDSDSNQNLTQNQIFYPYKAFEKMTTGAIPTVFLVYKETFTNFYNTLLKYLYRIFDNILELDTVIDSTTKGLTDAEKDKKTYLYKIFTRYKKKNPKKSLRKVSTKEKEVQVLNEEATREFNKIKKFIFDYKNLDEKDIQQFIEQKKTWDKEIIGKYHCPLRFQGNAINASIEELKKNLQAINTTKKNTYTSDTFPFDVWEVQHSEKYQRKNYVIFTNVRLDFDLNNYDDAKYKAFKNSLTFSEQLIKTKSIKFGKKISKKTSTRSFRKRGRHRGPSETEIL